jgi:hypothetical protein
LIVQNLFINSDDFNCPISYYLLNEEGRDLEDLLESGNGNPSIRIDKGGKVVIDETRYNGLTFVFNIMAVTRFNQPVVRRVKLINFDRFNASVMLEEEND